MYYSIVRQMILDSVPKTVMFFLGFCTNIIIVYFLLVNASKNNIQNELMKRLYKESLFDQLFSIYLLFIYYFILIDFCCSLFEDEGMAARRKMCLERQKSLSEANLILDEITFSPSFYELSQFPQPDFTTAVKPDAPADPPPQNLKRNERPPPQNPSSSGSGFPSSSTSTSYNLAPPPAYSPSSSSPSSSSPSSSSPSSSSPTSVSTPASSSSHSGSAATSSYYAMLGQQQAQQQQQYGGKKGK
jgi:hypothetical protein